MTRHLLLLVAAVLNTVGAGMVYLPAGFIAAGVQAAAAWWLLADDNGRS